MIVHSAFAPGFAEARAVPFLDTGLVTDTSSALACAGGFAAVAIVPAAEATAVGDSFEAVASELDSEDEQAVKANVRIAATTKRIDREINHMGCV